VYQDADRILVASGLVGQTRVFKDRTVPVIASPSEAGVAIWEETHTPEIASLRSLLAMTHTVMTKRSV